MTAGPRRDPWYGKGERTNIYKQYMGGTRKKCLWERIYII